MGNILQNISIIVASLTAIYGVISWRLEHIAKRKIDLAEEVLCTIYELKDIITFIRNPGMYEGEGSTRKRANNETPDESRLLDNSYVVYERYNKFKEVFNNFHKLRYRYLANFGKKGDEPFKIIREVIRDIFTASRMLGQYWQKSEREFMSDKQHEDHVRKIEKFEKIFCEEGENDQINSRIDFAINICEEVCKSANNFGVLNFFKRYR
jgi:hypothetical protein